MLTKVKSEAGVQAVVNWSIVPAQAIVAKNMKQIGLEVHCSKATASATGNTSSRRVWRPRACSFRQAGCWWWIIAEQPSQKKGAGRLQAGLRGFQEDVSTFGGHAYDALMVVVEGLKKAGGPDREKVRDAIENLKGFVGTAGVFNYSAADHTGLNMDAFEMLTVKDGKLPFTKSNMKTKPTYII